MFLGSLTYWMEIFLSLTYIHSEPSLMPDVDLIYKIIFSSLLPI